MWQVRNYIFQSEFKMFSQISLVLVCMNTNNYCMNVGVAVVVIILPWLILAILPITIAYYYLLLHYRKSGSDLQRLDAVSRSPLQAMLSEAMDGSSTIRVFDQQHTFFTRFHEAVDVNSSALLNFVSAQRYVFVLCIKILHQSHVAIRNAYIVLLDGSVFELNY